MKRDMDLIREILLYVEEKVDKNGTDEITIMNYSKDTIEYHLQKLSEAGYINTKGHAFGMFVDGLTWDGHEFLDNIRDESIWNKTKTMVLEKAETASLSIVAEIAKKFMFDHLGLKQ